MRLVWRSATLVPLGLRPFGLETLVPLVTCFQLHIAFSDAVAHFWATETPNGPFRAHSDAFILDLSGSLSGAALKFLRSGNQNATVLARAKADAGFGRILGATSVGMGGSDARSPCIATPLAITFGSR